MILKIDKSDRSTFCYNDNRNCDSYCVSYNVIIEKNSLNKINEYFDLNRKVLIVTDSGVPNIYVDTIKKACKEAYVYCFKQGEKSKNIKVFSEILACLVDKSFTRTDCVVACGGGVVGDVSGFAASAYMRGIDFYNVPTTLLSQIDSSIGGKFAIDFEKLKNIVGAFYQPKGVLIDPNTLLTLDDRLMHAGLVEGIKMGATSNKELFDLIKNSKSLNDDIENIIVECLKIKASVVSSDPEDVGIRKVLNFGHTIGHAIEAIESGKLYHGECVALGMMYMASKEVKQELEEVLHKYNINTVYDINKNKKKILELIKHDKKMDGDMLTIVYVETIGSFEFRKISLNELEKYLEGSY